MQPHTLSCRGSDLGRRLAQTLATIVTQTLFTSSMSFDLAYGIGQRTVVSSLAFIPTLTLRVQRGASANSAKRVVRGSLLVAMNHEQPDRYN